MTYVSPLTFVVHFAVFPYVPESEPGSEGMVPSNIVPISETERLMAVFSLLTAELALYRQYVPTPVTIPIHVLGTFDCAGPGTFLFSIETLRLGILARGCDSATAVVLLYVRDPAKGELLMDIVRSVSPFPPACFTNLAPRSVPLHPEIRSSGRWVTSTDAARVDWFIQSTFGDMNCYMEWNCGSKWVGGLLSHRLWRERHKERYPQHEGEDEAEYQLRLQRVWMERTWALLDSLGEADTLVESLLIVKQRTLQFLHNNNNPRKAEHLGTFEGLRKLFGRFLIKQTIPMHYERSESYQHAMVTAVHLSTDKTDNGPDCYLVACLLSSVPVTGIWPFLQLERLTKDAESLGPLSFPLDKKHSFFPNVDKELLDEIVQIQNMDQRLLKNYRLTRKRRRVWELIRSSACPQPMESLAFYNVVPPQRSQQPQRATSDNCLPSLPEKVPPGLVLKDPLLPAIVIPLNEVTSISRLNQWSARGLQFNIKTKAAKHTVSVPLLREARILHAGCVLVRAIVEGSSA
ncbi:MAG: hypothetical protein KVP17_000476 [Porospora cf. gigantea B]|uniref:uncharacterized protein n=1 Tax=Porospora cf. gigantea B TaxID=2853592 RepID=UPI003571F279|nr:MAG: hypothetical protein KVP17_000476 [Porospora cf. gigantea B]